VVRNSEVKMPTSKSNSVNLAWRKKRASSRGPKPSVSADQIAHAAIHVADKEGLEAVTMQRIAGEIGLTTMALYRYVSSKSELVALMIDLASETAPVFGKPSQPWSVRLKEWARRCFSIYRDHPWFLEATSTRHSIMGPNELAWMEAVLAMLAESGLAPEERHPAFLALIGHVRGHATFLQIRNRADSGQQWTSDLIRLLDSQADRYPVLLKATRSGAFSKTPVLAFDFGIECILDGVQARVAGDKTRSPKRTIG
jgi:AcrR family transcriptional regulator